MTILFCITLSSQRPDGVRQVMWSPNSSWLAVAHTDGQIYLFDRQGHLVRNLTGHEGGTITIDWSPDSLRLASGGYDNLVKIWDATTGQLLQNLNAHNDIVAVVFWKPGGAQLLSISALNSNNFRVWDTTTWNNIATLNLGTINSAVWSPDGEQFAFVGTPTILAVGNSTTLEPVVVFDSHASIPYSVDWNTSGNRLVSGTQTGEIHLWNPATETALGVIASLDSPVWDVEFSPDDTRIAGAVGDGTVRIWNTGNFQEIATFNTDAEPSTVSWNPDGTLLAYGGLGDAASIAPNIVSSPTAMPLITNITASSGRTYQRGTLAVDQLPYTDRTYTFTQIPAALTGQEYIRTANADKALTGANFLTFTLTAAADVYVLWDNRYARPSWLPSSSWTDTGLTVTATDQTGTLIRRVYRRSYPAGTVSLSGNGLSQGVMYNVVAAPTP
jgi:WD40 repeat protein